MRQNDSAGAARMVRMAARMTAGWVTATIRPGVRLTESSQSAVRSISAMRAFPLPTPVVQVCQARVDFGCPAERLSGLAGAGLRPGQHPVHGIEVADRADLTDPDVGEGFVGGEPSG